MPATSSESSPATRAAADRCPGALRLAQAADGYLARIRLPGGFVTGEQLRVLAGLATELGDGRIELTSRGNVQLRALADNAAGPLTAALERAGLLPSLDHDRVRNVLASPLAGLDDQGSGRDLSAIVAALDDGLCARPRLAGLSGRFLFAIDDGRGDVAGLGADVVAVVRADGIVVNGLAVSEPAALASAPRSGVEAATGDSDIAAVMLGFAEAFLDERAAAGSSAWRIADLPDRPDRPDRPGLPDQLDGPGRPGGAERVRAAVAGRFGLAAVPQPSTPVRAARPVGLVRCQADAGSGVEPRSVTPAGLDSAVLIAQLGRLTAAQVTWLAARATGRAARLTPWRSVVLPDQPDAGQSLREAAGLGFGVDDRSPWLRVTACAGRPGCASARADVQADAAAFAARWPGRIVHVSGCERHCGRPAATEIDVTATSEGYEVAEI